MARPLARSPGSPLRRSAAGACLLLLAAACGGDAGPAPRPAGERFGPGVDKSERLPSGIHRKTILTRTYGLRKGAVNLHAEPFRVERFSMTEPVWILRWRSNTEDPDGTRAPDDIHCHTMFSNELVSSDYDEIFRGLYTDGFTPLFELPDGFAVKVEPDERMLFQPMFNNRRATDRKARMRLEIDFVPESERTRDYVALEGFRLGVIEPETYWIKPLAPDRKSRVQLSPATGRVHAIGAHLHPYGEYVELRRERTGEVLFTARMDKAGRLEDNRLSVYASAEGFYIERGEPLRITVVYDNTSDKRADAMGGFFVLFDPHGKPDA